MTGVRCGHDYDCNYEPDDFEDYLDHLTRSVDTDTDRRADP